MCGIAGIISSKFSLPELKQLVLQMGDRLQHRGPDSHGVWDEDGPLSKIALMHRRLSIIDLSPNGHQPMISPSGRYVITYNGEIYNFNELKRDLAEFPFRGGSDTEVFLAAIEKWGLETTLPKLRGMFAFALWDRKEKVLTLARDRFGVKPLSYGFIDGSLFFASEVNAFERLPQVHLTFDEDAAARSLEQLCIPAPLTIYKEIKKLPPGKMLRFDAQSGSLKSESWWDSYDAALAARENPFRGSYAQACEELDSLMQEAVQLRKISDVPIGCFLSGGIDSSLVASYLAPNIKTFTVGFSQSKDYDESQDARRVAEYLKTDHLTLELDENEALDLVPRMASLCDEPFGDSSQIATYLVARKAREYVTVGLSGDGGDEVFGGYRRHFIAQRWWKLMRLIPSSMRSSCAGVMDRNGFFAGRQASKLVRALGARNRRDLYARLALPQQSKLFSKDFSAGKADLEIFDENLQVAELMMLADTNGYLHDDVLTKVDRASMAVGLEAREPLLDHKIFEFAWRLPLSFKIEGGVGKRILRDLLNRRLPADFFDRPKRGFAVPVGTWMRGKLKPWAQEHLEALPKHFPWIHKSELDRLWQDHLTGKADHTDVLWAACVLSDWKGRR